VTTYLPVVTSYCANKPRICAAQNIVVRLALILIASCLAMFLLSPRCLFNNQSDSQCTIPRALGYYMSKLISWDSIFFQ